MGVRRAPVRRAGGWTLCFGVAGACLLGLACSASAGTVWLVSNDPNENPDFLHPQVALNSPLVVSGDIIEVSQGVGPYVAPDFSSFNFGGKSVVVRAQTGELPVLRYGAGGLGDAAAVVRFNSGETRDAVLEGFVIDTNVRAAIDFYGTSSPTIRNCRFQGESPHFATIYISVTGDGPLLEGCSFVDNTAILAPFFYVRGGATVVNSTFTNCGPDDSNEVFNLRGDVRFEGCSFVNCGPQSTSALRSLIDYVAEAPGDSLSLVACEFRDNVRNLASIVAATGPAQIANCLFARNGPLFELPLINARGGPMLLSHCTIADHGQQQGNLMGWVSAADVDVRGCVLWNTTGAAAASRIPAGTDIEYSIVQGGWAGLGNVGATPNFAYGYKPGPGSPAIDAGDKPSLPAGIALDLARRARFVDETGVPDTGRGSPPLPDIGAYEYFVCDADLTATAVPGSPGYGVPNLILSSDDFFYYLAQYAAGSLAVADLTATALLGTPGYGIPDGVLNSSDFFFYLILYSGGC